MLCGGRDPGAAVATSAGTTRTLSEVAQWVGCDSLPYCLPSQLQ